MTGVTFPPVDNSPRDLPMVIHQSDLQAWNRCPAEFAYSASGHVEDQNSASAWGTVIHHALHVLERYRDLDQAIETFLYYWHPLNIDQLTEPIPRDGWLPRQGYNELRQRGVAAIRRYADVMRVDQHELLALEFDFLVPLHGRSHWLAGTVDRLAVRWHRKLETLCIDDWKALALDTPLPTPDGWSTMRAVQVGERLFGADGQPCEVVGKSAVYEGRPCYRVTFDDGSSVVCDAEHLWHTLSGRAAQHSKVLTTREVLCALVGSTGQRHQRVPNAEPLQLPERVLPIHPYVLGAWLGDGRVANGEVCKPDEELFEQIAACGYDVAPPNKYDSRTVYGLRSQLRVEGLLGMKVVPERYLRASREQRLALLQGMMDTDGTWNRVRNQAVFTSCDKALAESVRELVLTLGSKARIWECEKEGFGRRVTAYDVTFSPVGFNPFRLSRKATLVRAARTRARRRVVVAVEPTISVPVQCVEVDSPDSLYLCGEAMVPTHNSGKQKWNLRHNVQGTMYAYASLQSEFWTGAEGTFRRPFREEPIHYKTKGFSEQGPERVEELAERFGLAWWEDVEPAPRRFTWINLREQKWKDGGYRGPRDYQRMTIAVDQVVRSIDAGIFPLTVDGEVCTFCLHRNTCGGPGLPDGSHGAPYRVGK